MAMLFCLNCWDVCGEDGSERTSGSSLVEHYLKNDQADICPKDQPLSVQEDIVGAFQFLGIGSRGLTICAGHNHQWLQAAFHSYPQPVIAKKSLLSS